MGFATETLLILLAAGGSGVALGLAPQAAATDGNSPAVEDRESYPGASASAPSPTPTPRYKLIPYAFETPQSRSTAPLLRFEDRTEVRSLEMNQAIARFFDRGDDNGNMLRGATPGGAPTLREMASYRPHVTPGADLLGVAALAAREIRKQLDRRKGMLPAEPSPSPSPPDPSR
jgi:hypothetical protein